MLVKRPPGEKPRRLLREGICPGCNSLEKHTNIFKIPPAFTHQSTNCNLLCWDWMSSLTASNKCTHSWWRTSFTARLCRCSRGSLPSAIKLLRDELGHFVGFKPLPHSFEVISERFFFLNILRIALMRTVMFHLLIVFNITHISDKWCIWGFESGSLVLYCFVYFIPL